MRFRGNSANLCKPDDLALCAENPIDVDGRLGMKVYLGEGEKDNAERKRSIELNRKWAAEGK